VLGELLPTRRCLLGGRAAVSRHEVRARREVVLSAGAYESPHLLLKSGVGAADALRAAGIEPVVELPGVGQRLQDHPIIGIKYRFGPRGGAWLPSSVSKLWLALPSLSWSYLAHGKGALASSGCDIGYFGASNASYANRPDLQVHSMLTAGDAAFFHGFLHLDKAFTDHVGEPADYSSLWAQGVCMAPTLLHPATQGSIELNPENRRADGTYGPGPPKIRFEAFGDADDVRRTIEAIRRMQAIMAQPAMAAHEPTLLHHRGLAAEFGADSDTYWAEYIKRFGFVVYHPTGTLRMGRKDEPGTVVDSSLRVLGVAGLRVADASVMPDIVSGNTQVPTAAVGVQMVDILSAEYNGAHGHGLCPTGVCGQQ